MDPKSMDCRRQSWTYWQNWRRPINLSRAMQKVLIHCRAQCTAARVRTPARSAWIQVSFQSSFIHLVTKIMLLLEYINTSFKLCRINHFCWWCAVACPTALSETQRNLYAFAVDLIIIYDIHVYILFSLSRWSSADVVLIQIMQNATPTAFWMVPL